MEPASLQLTVLALASLLAAAAAIAALARAFVPASQAANRPNRAMQIVWALVPLLVLGSVLLAMKVDG